MLKEQPAHLVQVVKAVQVVLQESLVQVVLQVNPVQVVHQEFQV